jgi:hypothetical protein
MLRKLAMLLVAVLVLIAVPVAGDEKSKESMLADAVQEFNQRAQDNATGKDQPALTEDEVVAAIRGWVRERHPATDEVYKVYQTIADTKKLPEGATLTFTTKWTGFNKHEFDVWWVDLNIRRGATSGYTFRIRDQKLRCRPIEPKGGPIGNDYLFRLDSTGFRSPGR